MTLTDEERMAEIDTLLSHVWMVRTFIKHAEETEEDDDLKDVQRDLYDFMLALGQPLRERDSATYLKMARKKLRKLKAATELFLEVQPEISNHTTFEMSATSLKTAVGQIKNLLTPSSTDT